MNEKLYRFLTRFVEGLRQGEEQLSLIELWNKRLLCAIAIRKDKHIRIEVSLEHELKKVLTIHIPENYDYSEEKDEENIEYFASRIKNWLSTLNYEVKRLSSSVEEFSNSLFTPPPMVLDDKVKKDAAERLQYLFSFPQNTITPYLYQENRVILSINSVLDNKERIVSFEVISVDLDNRHIPISYHKFTNLWDKDVIPIIKEFIKYLELPILKEVLENYGLA
jgi:hypothetical protein|nr:MAG TPA: hypothetical protein [Caudoviricetes sp.]